MLFLDEMPEFSRHVLEVLREPLESGSIHIARATRRAEFPARFLLVGAMNPCPCGYLGHPRRACRCTAEAIARYQQRLSGPLLDRIDLQVTVGALLPEELLQAPPGEPSAAIAARVVAAHARQLARQGKPNSQLGNAEASQHCPLAPEAAALLAQAMQRFAWSARACLRVLKLARTIADLAGVDEIGAAHLGEAVQYRRAAFEAAG